MKKTGKGNVVLVLLFIAGILLFSVLANRQEIMDYSKIKAAGRKTLTPVNVKQKTTTRHQKRRTVKTTTNYVQFIVEINNKKMSFWMKTSAAYGENTPSAGLAAVSSKKKIERYIFYTDSNIYYSEKAATIEEYIRESIKNKLLVFFILTVVFGVIFMVTYFSRAAVGKRKIKTNN